VPEGTLGVLRGKGPPIRVGSESARHIPEYIVHSSFLVTLESRRRCPEGLGLDKLGGEVVLGNGSASTSR